MALATDCSPGFSRICASARRNRLMAINRRCLLGAALSAAVAAAMAILVFAVARLHQGPTVLRLRDECGGPCGPGKAEHRGRISTGAVEVALGDVALGAHVQQVELIGGAQARSRQGGCGEVDGRGVLPRPREVARLLGRRDCRVPGRRDLRVPRGPSRCGLASRAAVRLISSEGGMSCRNPVLRRVYRPEPATDETVGRAAEARMKASMGHGSGR